MWIQKEGLAYKNSKHKMYYQYLLELCMNLDSDYIFYS
jgi:hypothetical protein